MTRPGVAKLRAKAWNREAAHHLLRRAGFGGGPADIDALAAMGCEGAVAHLLEYESIPEGDFPTDEFSPDIRRPPTEEEREMRRRAINEGDESALGQLERTRNRANEEDRKQAEAVGAWWFRRILASPRPLEEKMTLFWHGHFASSARTVQDSWHMLLQNQTLRANATGNFARFVHAILHDPAMLKYLDSDENRRGSPNENLARELMELFVLGEGRGYTESDIKEGARALTGYTIADDEFAFRLVQHDTGSKTILGKSGHFDGDDFADIILARPEASEFIVTKLYRFFVNDAPGAPAGAAASFCGSLARTFRDEKYEIKPVLREIFRSEHFYEPANRGAVVKSPVHLMAEATRTFGLPERDYGMVRRTCTAMGQVLGAPPSVKGWAGGRPWISTSTLFARQNTLAFLLTGRGGEGRGRQSQEPGWSPMHLVEHLRHDGRVSPGDAVDCMLGLCLAVAPHADRRRVLLDAFANQDRGMDERAMMGLLCLVTALPEYQLC